MARGHIGGAGKSAKTAAAALATLLALTGCTSPSQQRAERMPEYLRDVELQFVTMAVPWDYNMEVAAERIGNETCNTLDKGYAQGELMYRQGLLKAPDDEMRLWYTEMVGVAARSLCPEHKETIYDIFTNNPLR